MRHWFGVGVRSAMAMTSVQRGPRHARPHAWTDLMLPPTNLSNTGYLTVLRGVRCGETFWYQREEGEKNIYWRRAQGTLRARLSPCVAVLLIALGSARCHVVVGAWTNGARSLKIRMIKSIRGVWLLTHFRRHGGHSAGDGFEAGRDARLRMLCTVRWPRHPVHCRASLGLGWEDITIGTEFCTC